MRFANTTTVVVPEPPSYSVQPALDVLGPRSSTAPALAASSPAAAAPCAISSEPALEPPPGMLIPVVTGSSAVASAGAVSLSFPSTGPIPSQLFTPAVVGGQQSSSSSSGAIGPHVWRDGGFEFFVHPVTGQVMRRRTGIGSAWTVGEPEP